MLTELTPNKAGWFSTIMAVVLPLAFVGFLTYNFFVKPANSIFYLNPANGYIYWLCFAAALISCVMSIRKCYSMTIGAAIDDSLKTVDVKYFIKGKRFIRRDEMVSYTYTAVTSRNSTYQGLYLYLSDGSKILFSDLNFSDYSPIEIFLSDNQVERISD